MQGLNHSVAKHHAILTVCSDPRHHPHSKHFHCTQHVSWHFSLGRKGDVLRLRLFPKRVFNKPRNEFYSVNKTQCVCASTGKYSTAPCGDAAQSQESSLPILKMDSFPTPACQKVYHSNTLRICLVFNNSKGRKLNESLHYWTPGTSWTFWPFVKGLQT